MTERFVKDDSTEFRQFAADWHGGQSTALYRYASTGSVVSGLGFEIRQVMRSLDDNPKRDAELFANAFALGRFLGHVADLEDSLTGEWHDCDRCGETYDETTGDGYFGLCPSCADATEPPEEDQ